jgi:hypothetical protein
MDNQADGKSVVSRTLVVANSVAAGALALFCTCAAAADLTGPAPPLVMPISSSSGFGEAGHVGGVPSGEAEFLDFGSDNLRSALGVGASCHFAPGSLFGHW